MGGGGGGGQSADRDSNTSAGEPEAGIAHCR